MFENAVAGIPEGYEFVAYRVPKYGELYLNANGDIAKYPEHFATMPTIVVQKEWIWPKWLIAPYIAMDKNGKWYAYNRKPEPLDICGGWTLAYHEGRSLIHVQLNPKMVDFSPPPCKDWTTSLRANPNLKYEQDRVADEIIDKIIKEDSAKKKHTTVELLSRLWFEAIGEDYEKNQYAKLQLTGIAQRLGVIDEFDKKESWDEKVCVLIWALEPKKPANLVYLAVPYSHVNEMVRNGRFHYANRAAAALMKQGYWVFSPISHSHHIAKYLESHESYESWREFDEFMIAQCSKLIVLMLPGWHLSKGVKAERAKAQELGISVEYRGPEHLIPGYSEDRIPFE